VTYEHILAGAAGDSPDGWLTYKEGIAGLWREVASLTKEEFGRLFHLRTDVVKQVSEQGLVYRSGPQSNLLYVRLDLDGPPHGAVLGWTREEDILALDLFVKAGSLNGGPLPGKADPRVVGLSQLLRDLPVYPRARRGPRFRNPGGVALKLANFRAVERAVKLGRGIPGAESLPAGMPAFSALDRAVFEEFFDRGFDGLSVEAQAIRAAATGLEDAIQAPTVEDRPVENPGVSTYETTDAVGGTRTRAEHELVSRYVAGLSAVGITAVSHLYRVPGQARPLFCDIVLPAKNLLIEAKASSGRDSIRMAIGQLLDYQRFEQTKPQLAVLLPHKPDQDICDLLSSADIALIWADGDTFLIQRAANMSNRYPGATYGRQAVRRNLLASDSPLRQRSGRIDPPTFRFSGGFASPGPSTTGRLTRPYDALAPLEVQDHPHVSTAVVSRVLARSAMC
jgi:hypothetical protein